MVEGGGIVRRCAYLVEIAGGAKFLVAASGLADACEQVKELTKREEWCVNDRQVVAVAWINARLVGFVPTEAAA